LYVFYLTIFPILSIFVSCSSLILQQVDSQESDSAAFSRMLENRSTEVSNTSSNTQGVLGITVENVTSKIAEFLKLQNTTGIVVTDVHPLSSADQAGILSGNNLTQIDGKEVLLGGDIILRIDNIVVNQTNDIVEVLERKMPGDRISLTLLRNGHIEDRSLTLEAERDLPPFIERLAGKYINHEAGLQMYLPQGWSGFRMKNVTDFGVVGPNIINITDLGKQNVLMSFLIVDLPFMQNTTSETNSNSISIPSLSEDMQRDAVDCNILSESYSLLNETITLDVVNECNILGNYTKARSSILATEKKLIAITFSANSAELYDANLAKYDKSLASLKVDNPADVSKVLADLSTGNQTVGPAVANNGTASIN
jgi:hypothetical protein